MSKLLRDYLGSMLLEALTSGKLNNLLVRYAKSGDLGGVRDTLQSDGITQEGLDRALRQALGKKHFTVSTYLIQSGADITAPNVLAAMVAPIDRLPNASLEYIIDNFPRERLDDPSPSLFNAYDRFFLGINSEGATYRDRFRRVALGNFSVNSLRIIEKTLGISKESNNLFLYSHGFSTNFSLVKIKYIHDQIKPISDDTLLHIYGRLARVFLVTPDQHLNRYKKERTMLNYWEEEYPYIHELWVSNLDDDELELYRANFDRFRLSRM